MCGMPGLGVFAWVQRAVRNQLSDGRIGQLSVACFWAVQFEFGVMTLRDDEIRTRTGGSGGQGICAAAFGEKALLADEIRARTGGGGGQHKEQRRGLCALTGCARTSGRGGPRNE